MQEYFFRGFSDELKKIAKEGESSPWGTAFRTALLLGGGALGAKGLKYIPKDKLAPALEAAGTKASTTAKKWAEGAKDIAKKTVKRIPGRKVKEPTSADILKSHLK